MRSSTLKGATLVLGACFAAIAQAQPAFPSRPVSLVLPSAPGDPTDLIARVLQPRMSERLREPFLVENRPGGSAVIASSAVAKAQPDGHTLLLALSAHSINPIALNQLPYDTFRDFAPVTLLARFALIVGANAAVRGQNLREFIGAARAHGCTANSSRPLPKPTFGRNSARPDSRSSARALKSSTASCAGNSSTGTGSCANSTSSSSRSVLLIAQRSAYHHHADPPGDLLVLDDEDLAALAVRAAAGRVVAAPGEGARRAHAEVAGLLDRGDVPQALERASDVGDDLVDAGDEEEPARAEGVGGDAVAAAVRVDDLARFGDGVDAADEIVGDRGAAARARALLGIVHRLHARAQPVVRPVLQRVEKADLLERRRDAVLHRRAGRDAREQIGDGGRAVGRSEEHTSELQ